MAGFHTFGPLGAALPCSSALSALGALERSSLEAQCRSFLVQGLAPSRSSYRSGQKKFFESCTQLGKIHQSGSPCSANEWTLCLFATFLASSVQHSTIKVYLLAVCTLHIEQGFSDPLVDCLQLQRVLRGIKRTQGDSSSLGLPITDDIMVVIFWALDLTHPDHCMFWVVCNLAYFGFLRSAEFTVPNLASYVPDIHPGVADVAVDSHSSPSCLHLRIKASKTEWSFSQELFSAYWQGGVSTLRHFLPAGIFGPEGRCLRPIIISRALLTSWLHGILSAAGIQGNFSSHSFWIGAATVAARNGIPDYQIQALGRWTSSVYLLYIRTPAELLSWLSKQLSLSAANWRFIPAPLGSVWYARFCLVNFRSMSVPRVVFMNLA